MKNTVETFRQAKGREKLTMLTAYDCCIARIIDGCGINSILVGDSIGMVTMGYANTLPVTVDDMIRHCAMVARGCRDALLVCDMPFMSFQCGPAETLRNAGRIVKEGRAQAVKLEGGRDFAPDIRALVRASIPVMGHIGLTPQSVNALGGFKVAGRGLEAAKKLMDDARAIQDAGVFSMVLECVPAPLAERISQELEVPTIGIGAGAGCDGQVLVWQDMLGMNDAKPPKFVKIFSQVGEMMRQAFTAYSEEVKNGTFPASEHVYSLPDDEILKQL